MSNRDAKLVEMLSQNLNPGDELVEYVACTQEPTGRWLLSLMMAPGILPGLLVWQAICKRQVLGLTRHGLLLLHVDRRLRTVRGRRFLPFDRIGNLRARKVGFRRALTLHVDGRKLRIELAGLERRIDDGRARRDRIFEALCARSA